MARFLAPEWFDAIRALERDGESRPGASARIQLVVSGGPDGDVKCHLVVEDGRIVESALGELAGAEATMTMDYTTAVEIQQGTLDVNTAFMQGRAKVAGDMGAFMRVLPLTKAPTYGTRQEQIRAVTEF